MLGDVLVIARELETMREIDVRRLYLLRGSGGEKFANFCNSLISAETLNRIQTSSLQFNVKANVPDGGVDTKVDLGTDMDSTGWLKEKSIWQFKGTEGLPTEPELRDEINKDFSKRCIEQGYAYRFCICNSIAPQKIADWEGILNEERMKINSSAPLARVVTADNLANWTSNHWPIIISNFYPQLAGKIFDLQTHLKNITRTTQTYVENPEWSSFQKEIDSYIDFSNQPARPVLSIQGKAGVGKTRMVSETLLKNPHAAKSAVYSNNDVDVESLVHTLVASPNSRAIIIADECSLESKMRISDAIAGHLNRLRVIAIDNRGETARTIDPQLSLKEIPDDLVQKILRANFKDVPDDRIRMYANLSKGFVGLAAGLCAFDKEFLAAGHVEPTTQITDYYLLRLDEEQRTATEALSLFLNVGFKNAPGIEDGTRKQTDFVCSFSGIPRPRFEGIVNKLHDTPGYVGRAGRYYYVTPDIIAHVAFGFAWRRFVQGDPETFIREIPPNMVLAFVKRVSEFGGKDERKIVSDYFRSWVDGLSPSELSSANVVKKLESVAEASPDVVLPILRRKVEVATDKELADIRGDWDGQNWGARRTLIWLMERLAAFKEHFFDCETILFRLALAESEPKIGNNATAVWAEQFRILLSGTEVAFPERLSLLKKRLLTNNVKESDLALKALYSILNDYPTKTIGPKIVSGRIAPESWEPKTREEYRTCYDSVVAMLVELSKNPKNSMNLKCQDIAIRYCRTLLNQKKLDSLKTIFAEPIPEDTRLTLDSAIMDFIYFDTERFEKAAQKEYLEQVAKWKDSLKPTDFHGKMADLVGKDAWDYSIQGKEEVWEKNLQDVARDLLKDPPLFDAELLWLTSSRAKSAFYFGRQLGNLDSGGVQLLRILDASSKARTSALARGYVLGLMQNHPELIAEINNQLDLRMNSEPVFVYELAVTGGKRLNALSRTLKLIDSGVLSIQYLESFAYGSISTELLPDELIDIFQRLIAFNRKGDSNALVVGEKLLSGRFGTGKIPEKEALILDENVKSIVWDFLKEMTSSKPDLNVGHWWKSAIESQLEADPSRAIEICALGLICDNFSIRQGAKEILSAASVKHAALILEKLEPVMFSETTGFHFYLDHFRDIFQPMPPVVIQSWVDAKGIEAARKIARHLTSPYIEENGDLTVPGLTLHVLDKFGDDETVFREFMAGRHSGQMYTGDLAKAYDDEAEQAKKFFNHSNKHIRDWANEEYKSGKNSASYWRERHEEMAFD